MLNIPALIKHVNDAAADSANVLPAEWTAHHAWTMNPVESDDLPDEIPLVAFHQAREVFSPRTGSPCYQTALPSVIFASIACREADMDERVDQLRAVLYGWRDKGDRRHRPLYLTDIPSMPCEPLGIKGEIVWWQDVWLTQYAATSAC